MKTLRISAIQMNSGEDVAANLTRARRWLRSAAEPVGGSAHAGAGARRSGLASERSLVGVIHGIRESDERGSLCSGNRLPMMHESGSIRSAFPRDQPAADESTRR
jgi:hypothetical protein